MCISIIQHPVLTDLPGQLNQTIENKIAEERKDRERILEQLKQNIQQMVRFTIILKHTKLMYIEIYNEKKVSL